MLALVAALLALVAVPARGQSTPASIEDRFRRLEERQQQLEHELREKDRRIEDLERQLGTRPPSAAAPAEPPPAPAAAAPGAEPGPPAPAIEWGRFEPGKGFVLARTKYGEVDFNLWTYVRYLNQEALDDTYTDAFGRTRSLDLRNDIQLQKALLTFKGWVYDPKLRYRLYTWTSNTSQGQSAQVVVAGYLTYDFMPELALSAGIGGLPTTRSMQGVFPYFLKVDHRTIADEFFRGSYTTGLWAEGQLTEGLSYKVMVGNNLSQLGVDAVQLDNGLNTVSSAIWWMPTTGEFGPLEGYGDFENHLEPATLLGLRFTYSREDSQSQPDPEDIENSQIRLSDGTNLFDAGAFAPGAQVTRATYRMLSTDAGLKYRGFSLDGEYFIRWVDDFSTRGPVPVDDLFDHGFQLQGSAMVWPRTLQLYVAGSQIVGEFGEPWDLSVGLNWFPFHGRGFRLNGQALYLVDSPVGYSSVPFLLGGNGWVYSVDAELAF